MFGSRKEAGSKWMGSLLLQSSSELIKRIAFLTGHRSEPFSEADTRSEEERLADELAALAAAKESAMAAAAKKAN